MYFIVSLIGILQAGKMKWPKRCKACLTKPAMTKLTMAKPDTRPLAVQQLAIRDAVLETTVRLTQAATVM